MEKNLEWSVGKRISSAKLKLYDMGKVYTQGLRLQFGVRKLGTVSQFRHLSIFKVPCRRFSTLSGSRAVVINLPHEVVEDVLCVVFQSFGIVVSTVVFLDRSCKSQRYGIVHFLNEKLVSDVIQGMHGVKFGRCLITMKRISRGYGI